MQTLIPKCPNFLRRQVGQTKECLSKLIFVHTRLQGRQGTPNLDICPNFRRFFLDLSPKELYIELKYCLDQPGKYGVLKYYETSTNMNKLRMGKQNYISKDSFLSFPIFLSLSLSPTPSHPYRSLSLYSIYHHSFIPILLYISLYSFPFIPIP